MADSIEEDCMVDRKGQRCSGFQFVFVITILTFSVFLSYNLYISTLDVTDNKRSDNSDQRLNHKVIEKRQWDESDYKALADGREFESSTSSTFSSTSSQTSSSSTPEASVTDSTSSSSSSASSISPSKTSTQTSEAYSSSSSDPHTSTVSRDPSSSSTSTASSSSSSSSDASPSSTVSLDSSDSSSSSTPSSTSMSTVPSYTPSALPMSSSITSTVDYSTSFKPSSKVSTTADSTGFFSTTSPGPSSSQTRPSFTQSLLSTFSSMMPSLTPGSSTSSTRKATTRPTERQRPNTPSLVSSDFAKNAVEDYFNSVSMSTSKPAGQGTASTEPPPEGTGSHSSTQSNTDEQASTSYSSTVSLSPESTDTSSESSSESSSPSETSSETSETSSESSTSEETGLPTTPEVDLGTTTQADPCFREPYQLNKVCSTTLLKLTGVPNYQHVSLEDVSAMLFSHNVLQALQEQCPPSVWCLNHHDDISRDKKEYLQFCDMDCMLQMPDECLNKERRTVLAALGLLCEGRARNSSEACHQAMRKNAHVTMADIYRNKQGTTEIVCDGEMQKSCNGTCQQMAADLHCMCAACEHHGQDMLEQYAPWTWFFSNDTGVDQMDACSINATTVDCRLYDPQYADSWWANVMKDNTFLDAVQEMDAAIISGLITSFAITIIGVAAVVWVVVKRTTGLPNPCQRFYDRDEVEYTEIKNGEIDMFDSDLEA